MTNEKLNEMFNKNNFLVRSDSPGKWIHIISKEHFMVLLHNETKNDLIFKIELMPLEKLAEKVSYKIFLEFNTTLLHGAFAIENDHLIFIDRIPTFDLDWKEALRTILTAKKVSENLNVYLRKATTENG